MRAYLSKTWFVAIVAALIGLGASADVVTNSEPFTISGPTVWSGVTNIYTYTEGYSKINANLELKDRSYVRIVGGKAKVKPLDLGVRIADRESDDLTITINSYSAFYGTYRPSGAPPQWKATGIDDTARDGTGAIDSQVKFYIGAADGKKDSAGRATIVVNSRGADFGTSANSVGFWAERLFIEPTVKAHDTGYIDFLQLNTSDGVADITHIENLNTNYPARIRFQGGRMRHSYMNGNYGDQYVPTNNAVLVLEGINGYNIQLVKSYNSGRCLNGGMGTLRFQGDCEVQINDDGQILPGIKGSNRSPWKLDPTKGPIEWKQTKPLAIIGYGIVIASDTEGLPFRANEPEVRLRGNAILDPAADVYGHQVKLRTLISESSSAMVTNVISTSEGRNLHTATLVFGDGDTDGIFAAKCCQNINVEKVGSGLLVVSNVTVVGTLTIKEGRVMFAGKNNFANKVVIEDGVEVVAGLVPSTDVIKTIDFSMPKYTGDPQQVYVKEGDDEVLLYGRDYLEGKRLDIRGGTIRLAGTSEDKYWRFTIKSAMDDQTGALDAGYFEINEMFLWPSNYVKASLSNAKAALTWGITTNTPTQEASIKSPSQLAAERCMAEPRDMTWKTGNEGRIYNGPNVIFDNGAANCWHPLKYNGGKTVLAKLAETSTWFSVAFRLKDTALPAAGFAVARTHWSRGVGAWILSSSTSGKDDTWTVRHEHTVQWADTKGMYAADADKISEYPHCDDNDPMGKTQKESEKWYHNADIYRFTSGASAEDTFRGVHAVVADGATLDTGYISDAALSFASLDLDLTAGGGTITKFSPGEDGALYLTGLPAGTEFKKVRELPITVDSVVNPDRLASWNIYLDGVLQKGVAIILKDGKLCLRHSYGIYINFR